MAIKYYFAEIIEPPLLFGFLNSAIGISAAYYYHSLNLFMGVLALIGVVVAQIAVNLLDDYTDYKSGIDKETVKTKFSGGSPLLAAGLISLEGLKRAGIVALIIAAVIGVYISYADYLVIPFFIVGAASVLLYAKYFTKIPFLTEPSVAINFAIVGIGSFVAASGSLNHLGQVAMIAACGGLYVGIASFVNGMPDKIPDKKHGRRNAVILLDKPKLQAPYYLLLQAIIYAFIASAVALGYVPYTFLLVFVTVFTTAYIYKGILSYSSPKEFEKVMGISAIVGFAFTFLFSVFYII